MDSILKNLKVVADQLENNKLYKEAKLVDKVIRRVAARNTIDIDARVNSRDIPTTKQMINTYTRRISEVQQLMTNRNNPVNQQKLKNIAQQTEIAPDKADDFDGVLSLLQSGLQKYQNHLNQLSTGGQVQKPSAGSKVSVDRLPEGPLPEPSDQTSKPAVQTQQQAPTQVKQTTPVQEQTQGEDQGDVNDASIKEVAGQYGIPPALLKAMVNYKGINAFLPEPVQVMGDAKKYGPKKNLIEGAKYLSQMYKQLKTWPLAVGAFSAGPESVARYGGKVPAFAIKYVQQVMGNAGMNTGEGWGYGQ